MSWSFVGSVTTDSFAGVTTGTVHLPSGVQGGDAIIVICCNCPTTAPASVSIAGITQVPTNGSFAGGATSGNFGDFFWAGTRTAAGSIGSATTDTTFTITFGSATWAETLTYVLRFGAAWNIVGSGKYNGNAASTYSTTCPDASYTPSSSSNAVFWCYAGQNSGKGTTGSTFSGTGPSALSNFAGASSSANGGGIGGGWIQSTSAPGGATANQAIDATDFVIELAGTAPAPAGLAAGTGTSQPPAPQVKPNAGLATGTGAASLPLAGGIVALLAPGTGTAQPPGPQVTVSAGLASGTGTAQQPVAGGSTTVFPGLAHGTGTAQQPAALVQPAAGLAHGAGAASLPVFGGSNVPAPLFLIGQVLGSAVIPAGQPGGAGGPGGPAPSGVGAGWELGVYDSATEYQTLLCKIPVRMWNSFSFSQLLNDKGSGTVVLNMDDPWWTTTILAAGGLAPHYILDEEHCFRVFQDGVERFDFLGETITEQLIQQSEQRLVTITGPGSIATLGWAMAAPPGFPNTIVYKTDALTDSFSEINSLGQFVIDYGLWNSSANTSSISINPSGSAQLIGTPGGTVLGSNEWDFTNTLFSAQVTPIVSPDLNNVTLNGSQVTQMYIETAAGYYVMIGMSSSSLYAQYHGPDGTATQVIATAADYAAGQSATNQFSNWQISEANGTFFFWTSADGQTWTQVWSHARGYDSSQSGVFFAAVYSGSTTEFASITSINSDVTASSLGGATYLNEPIMGVYQQTLASAKARNTIPYVNTQMTQTADSFGNPWTDSQSVQIQNGTDLYALLQAHASMVDADYLMLPRFKLVVGLPSATEPNEGQVTLGYDRSKTIRFFSAERIMLEQRQRQRQNIQNLIAVINSDSVTVTAANAPSVATWQQREAWVQAAAQVTQDDLNIVASAASQQSASEVLSYTIQVVPWANGKTIFRDFQVGDWIGLERPDFSAVDVVRVIGITVSLDQDGNEVHELTLQSYIQWLEQRLQYIATKMGGGFISANGTTAISNNAQGSTLQAPTVFSQSLSSLGVPTASGGAPLVYNPVTGQWLPAGSTNPVTGSEAPLVVTSSGGTVSVSSSGVVVAQSGTPAALNPNPTFAGGAVTGWQGVSASIAAVTPSAGLPSQAFVAQVTPSSSVPALIQAATANAPVQGGSQYTLYAYVFLPAQANMGITTEITWYTSTGIAIQTDALSSVVPASQWVQLAYQDIAPANAFFAQVAVGITSGSGANPGQFGNVQLVQGGNAAGSAASSTAVAPTGTVVTDSSGQVRIITGVQADGTVTTTYANGPAPEIPSTPVVTGIMLGLQVTWDGLINGAPPLSDFLFVEVHVSLISGFTPSSATLYSVLGAAGTDIIGQLIGNTPYYVKLVAYNESGISSVASAQATATTQTVPSQIPAGSITEIMLGTGVGGATVTIGPTAPPTPRTGDLWYDSAAGYILQQYSGTAWLPYQFGTNAIAAGSITAQLIAAGTITAAQMAAGTITALQIAANTITAGNIAFGTLTGAQIAANTISAANIQAGTITAVQIATGTITAANIQAGSITGNVIAAQTITATNISAGTITGNLIAAHTITAGHIAAGTITGGQIAASVSLTSPVITGGTITGGTIIADGTSGEVLVYSGTPTSGNLLVAISGASGSDSSGNAYSSGITLTGQGSTPSSVSGSAVLYGTSAGSLQCVDGLDGNTYQTQRLTQYMSSNFTTTTTTLNTIFTAQMGVRAYRIYCWMLVTANSNVAISVNVAGPGSAGGQMSMVMARATSFYDLANFGINAGGTALVAMTSGNTYVLTLDGIITNLAVAGPVAIQVACATTPNSLTIVRPSFFDLMPV